jgi:hypothetical protein
VCVCVCVCMGACVNACIVQVSTRNISRVFSCVYLSNASYGFTYLRSARAPHEGICGQVEELKRRENEQQEEAGPALGGAGGVTR